MSEKIAIAEIIDWNKRTLLSSAILSSLSQNKDEDYGIIPGETKELTVELKINGLPVKLRSWFKHLDDELDHMIELEAGKLLRARLGTEDYSAIDDIQNMVKQLRDNLFEKYFPNDPEFKQSR